MKLQLLLAYPVLAQEHPIHSKMNKNDNYLIMYNFKNLIITGFNVSSFYSILLTLGDVADASKGKSPPQAMIKLSAN